MKIKVTTKGNVKLVLSKREARRLEGLADFPDHCYQKSKVCDFLQELADGLTNARMDGDFSDEAYAYVSAETEGYVNKTAF
jgi:hypothetical protein